MTSQQHFVTPDTSRHPSLCTVALTCLAKSSLRRSSSFSFSSASWAALKRRERCWFIFARGATPSAGSRCSLHKRLHQGLTEGHRSSLTRTVTPSKWHVSVHTNHIWPAELGQQKTQAAWPGPLKLLSASFLLLSQYKAAQLTNSHVEQLAWPGHAKQAVDVVEHGEKHLCLGGGSRLQHGQGDGVMRSLSGSEGSTLLALAHDAGH